MNIYEALNQIDRHYDKIKTSCCTSTRKYHADIILEIMTVCPETKQYWCYNPNEFMIVNRFCRIPLKYSNEAKITIVNHTVHDETYLERNPPIEEGLYFIGCTTFNPFTKEPQYWVKIGRSDDIKKRLRNYDTHSPSIHHIDYKVCRNSPMRERQYHILLNTYSVGRSERSTEWWLVDELTYLQMSEQGFKWFSSEK